MTSISSTEETQLISWPIKPLGISGLIERMKMGKDKKNNMDASSEFNKGLIVDLIQTIREDKEFMREEFSKNRESSDDKFEELRKSSDTKFTDLYVSLKETKIEAAKLETEFKLFKWLFGAIAFAIVAGAADRIFGG